MATPYVEETNWVEKEFLESHGIRVVKMQGLSLLGEEMRNAPVETTYNLACEVNTLEAEAIFISCTGFKSITIIEGLEEKLGENMSLTAIQLPYWVLANQSKAMVSSLNINGGNPVQICSRKGR